MNDDVGSKGTSKDGTRERALRIPSDHMLKEQMFFIFPAASRLSWLLSNVVQETKKYHEMTSFGGYGTGGGICVPEQYDRNNPLSMKANLCVSSKASI
jgi:hypothetical protein